jgi:hypothetical protein
MTTKSIIERGVVTCLPSREDNVAAAVDLQRKILNSIIDQVNGAFPNSENIVMNTTFLDIPVGPDRPLDELVKCIRHPDKIENIFLVSLIDDVNDPFDLIIHDREFNVFQLGYINDKKYEQYYVSMASILMKHLFKEYTQSELILTSQDPVKYLCYQNKPHLHRQQLAYKIMQEGFLNQGILTLNQGEYQISNLYLLSSSEEVEEFDNGRSSKEDPYTLGPMSVWQKCFLNVISETKWNNEYFITEKTYKPIIGLRPFILVGNPGTLKYLEENGFYTFEEYWNVNFREQLTDKDIINATVKVIDQICQMSSNEILNLYKEMLPKLIHNRNRFFEHANEQENKIYSLFK